MSNDERVTAPAHPRGPADAPESVAREPRDRLWVVPRASLSAVVVGTILALAMLFLLHLLGVGVGLAAFDPAAGMPTVEEFGMGAAIWSIVTFLIALFLGGWVAGRLAGDPMGVDGMLHGLVTWALTLLIVMWLATTAVAAVVGGAFAMVGGATTGLQDALAGEDIAGTLQQELEQALPEDADADPEALAAALQQVVMEGGDREAVEDVLVEQGGLSRDEAQRAMDDMEEQYQQVAQQVGEQAEEAAQAVSSAAIWSFVGLLLGAGAAGLGGWIGAPRDELTAPAERRQGTQVRADSP